MDKKAKIPSDQVIQLTPYPIQKNKNPKQCIPDFSKPAETDKKQKTRPWNVDER
jgi:hypothetical protein